MSKKESTINAYDDVLPLPDSCDAPLNILQTKIQPKVPCLVSKESQMGTKNLYLRKVNLTPVLSYFQWLCAK